VLTENDPNDRLTSAYLEGKEIPVETIRAAIPEQTLKRLIQPVLCGSGREHIGIQPLLDAACWYLPSPLDRPPVVGTNPRKPDKDEKRKPDVKEPFCGLGLRLYPTRTGVVFHPHLFREPSRPIAECGTPAKIAKSCWPRIYHIHGRSGQGS